jgi:DNA-binding response OmpR family regulator
MLEAMNEPAKILVVDDDADVLDMVTDYLTQEGFAVSAAHNAAEARRLMNEQSLQLAILDLRMPGEDGLSLARHLREHYALGIIMLTAADRVMDRVVGLEVGADDYLVKPFDLRELLARVRSVLRRASPQAAANLGEGRVRFGRCALDLGSHRLFEENGREVALTATEFDLLQMFARHPNRVLSRDEILDLTRNRERDPFDRSVDLHITRLRRKIEYNADTPQTIKTVRGAGYMFTPHRPA